MRKHKLWEIKTKLWENINVVIKAMLHEAIFFLQLVTQIILYDEQKEWKQ